MKLNFHVNLAGYFLLKRYNTILMLFIFSKKKLREELRRALMEAEDDGGIQKVEASNLGPISFKDLVRDFTSNRRDIKTFAITTKTAVSLFLYIYFTCLSWEENGVSISKPLTTTCYVRLPWSHPHPPIGYSRLLLRLPYLCLRIFIWTYVSLLGTVGWAFFFSCCWSSSRKNELWNRYSPSMFLGLC